LLPDANAPIRRPPPSGEPRGDKTRTSELPSVRPDPEPTEHRSRFDAAERVVLYNNPRANPDDLAEEMVRMMVRVRRHMPRRR
jgi:hypothetical protein